MAGNFEKNQKQQFIDRLLRQSDSVNENSFVTSTGGKISGFVAKIINHESFNNYSVRAVELGPAGSFPVVMGNQITAVNVAENFLAQGTLPAGTFVIIFRVADKYVFSVQV